MQDFPRSKRSANPSMPESRKVQPKPMGRPSLNVKRMVIRLPADTIARIKAVAGERRVAAFLREAAMEKLLRDGAKPKPKKGQKPK
jgi:hypothetical protein